MTIRIPEKALEWQKKARAIADQYVRPLAKKYDKAQEYNWEATRIVAEEGLLGVFIPPEYGGTDGSVLSLCLVVEELARADSGYGVAFAVNALGSFPLQVGGTEEQKKRWLPQIARGEKLISFGLSEKEAGSDAQNQQARAVEKDGAWVVNGTKFYCTNGSHAATVVFTAVTGTLPSGKKEITPFVVEKGTPGFKYGTKETKLGMRSSDTRVLHFEDMRLPPANVLGGLENRGKGFKKFMQTLDGGRISIGALGVGLAQGALDEALSYAKERKQFGRPIGSFQALQHRFADLATELEAARLMTYWVASKVDEDPDRMLPREASMVKLFVTETAQRVALEGMQMMGGYGYSSEYDMERLVRSTLVSTIYGGTSEIQRGIIAKTLGL